MGLKNISSLVYNNNNNNNSSIDSDSNSNSNDSSTTTTTTSQNWDLSIMGKIISLIFNEDSLLDNNDDNDCIIIDEPICITRYNTYNSTLFDTISNKKNNDDTNNK